ncbi:protein CHROMOSOME TRANSMISSION FIDELITY 7 [Impatiens glandulifera]|uniref:protein CHROMOSOME TRANSMISSION FIDELITY 7 n=1 Tax=Impatiens glandulifera TaxID=253017 RepID=UPI001FB14694|nr:protein CHROMOSOME TRANSMISSION FIDELITY 7 [Impatiens glandulifera]
MQPKITSFFNSSSTPQSPELKNISESDNLFGDYDSHLNQSEIRIIYKRRSPEQNPIRESDDESINGKQLKGLSEDLSLNRASTFKKRSYAQFHLELGQSDFLLRTCSICGFKYAAGDEGDEYFHKTIHKNFTHGIQFKGWRKEREIQLPSVQSGRVILVLDNDSVAQKNKVHEVLKMMEMELGDGWIFHQHCKVYLFITSQRIAGCLIAETITKAHRLISSSVNKRPKNIVMKKAQNRPTELQFGKVCFQRQVVKRSSVTNSGKTGDEEEFFKGAICCEEESVPAVCGIRAIWVSLSNRRKHIATHLLDAARINWYEGEEKLEASQMAFSQPSSTGMALAASYTGTTSFLVYKACE